MALRQIESLDEFKGIEKGVEILLAHTAAPVHECRTLLGRYEEIKDKGIILSDNVLMPILIIPYLERPQDLLKFMRAVRCGLNNHNYVSLEPLWHNMTYFPSAGAPWNAIYAV